MGNHELQLSLGFHRIVIPRPHHTIGGSDESYATAKGYSLIKVVAVWIGIGPGGFLIANVLIDVQIISALGIKAKERVNLVVDPTKGPHIDP